MYRDSVGNTYKSVPPAKSPPSAGKSKNGNKKHGRNKVKCAKYRAKHSKYAAAEAAEITY